MQVIVVLCNLLPVSLEMLEETRGPASVFDVVSFTTILLFLTLIFGQSCVHRIVREYSIIELCGVHVQCNVLPRSVLNLLCIHI